MSVRVRRRFGLVIGVAIVAALSSCFLWATHCFKEKTVSRGTYLGLTIGADKKATFKTVLQLQRAGKMDGFWGVDDNPVPTRPYQWSAASGPGDFDRLCLYDSWTLVDRSQRWLASVRFKEGLLAVVDPYGDDGNVRVHLDQWSPSLQAESLTAGLTPQEAAAVVRQYLSHGQIARIESTAHDVAPPSRFDEAGYPAMEPWDKWQLGVLDYGGLWLTFEQGRLVRIHHRIQCIELP